jgi:hypothetical protein
MISSNVDRGLVISGLSTLYVTFGYFGYFGKRWIAEGHERAAFLGFLIGLGIAAHDLGKRNGDVSARSRFAVVSILAVIVGFPLILTGAWREPSLVALAGIYLGIAGFHYLRNHAASTGAASAKQFSAAPIFAGIVGFALIAAGAILTALMVVGTMITIVVPWLPWPYDEHVRRLAILAILAGAIAIVLAAISEFVVRRDSIKKVPPTQEPSPHVSSRPETTIAIASAAFLLSLSLYSMNILFSFSLLMARKNASLFPKGAVTWLWQNHNLSWALLPSCLATFAIIAALHAYLRARWTGAIEGAPKLLDSAMRVAITCIGSSLLLLVLIGFVAPTLPP